MSAMVIFVVSRVGLRSKIEMRDKIEIGNEIEMRDGRESNFPTELTKVDPLNISANQRPLLKTLQSLYFVVLVLLRYSLASSMR